MKSGKKILRIYSRLNVGGPSYHVVNLSRGLEQYGYTTQLLVGRPPEWEGDLFDYARDQMTKVVVLEELGPKISIFNDLIVFLKIVYLMICEKPDIVHTHTFKAGLLGRLAALVTFRPTIVHTYHGHLLSGYWGRVRTFILGSIERFLNHFTDAVVVVSEKIKKDLETLHVCPIEKMHVIELGFNMDYLNCEIAETSDLRFKLGIPKSGIVIGSAGRMVPIKNYSLFLQSLVPLAKENPLVYLLLVGDGPCRPALEKLADELCQTEGHMDHELRSRILFLDWIVPFQRHLKAFNIYVCSSKNEGTSVAVIESLISGVPVVSTDVGGMSDVLGNGLRGKLVPQRANCLRTACQELIMTNSRSDNFYNLKEIAVQTQCRFDQERLFLELAHLYKELLC